MRQVWPRATSARTTRRWCRPRSTRATTRTTRATQATCQTPPTPITMRATPATPTASPRRTVPVLIHPCYPRRRRPRARWTASLALTEWSRRMTLGEYLLLIIPLHMQSHTCSKHTLRAAFLMRNSACMPMSNRLTLLRELQSVLAFMLWPI